MKPLPRLPGIIDCQTAWHFGHQVIRGKRGRFSVRLLEWASLWGLDICVCWRGWSLLLLAFYWPRWQITKEKKMEEYDGRTNSALMSVADSLSSYLESCFWWHVELKYSDFFVGLDQSWNSVAMVWDLVYSSIKSQHFWAFDAATRCPGNIYLGKNFLLPSFRGIFTALLVTSLLKCERIHMANWTDLVIWPHSPLTLDLNTAMNHCPEVVQILQPGHRCPWHRPGFWPRCYHTFGRHISLS